MSDGVLIYGDTERSADLFHAIPIGIIDAFAYFEIGDRKVAVISNLERDRVLDLGIGIDVIDPNALGMDELIRAGWPRHEAELKVLSNACEHLGVRSLTVPPETPVAAADQLRSTGVELDVDFELFVERRRTQTEHQLAGIRRAQKAADAAMAAAARLLREMPAGISSESIRAAMQAVCREHAAELPEDVIVSVNAQAAIGHESGSGPVTEGDIVLIDIWPRDTASRCWADMTRTFVAGGAEPDPELAEFWRLTRAALDASLAEIRAGANGGAAYAAACKVYEDAGQPTRRAAAPGSVLESGFFHGLGHGVGLEVHERPNMGLASDTLKAGDVITVEPGCYRPGYGGVRLEDIVLVTEDGYELLTDFPYELQP